MAKRYSADQRGTGNIILVLSLAFLGWYLYQGQELLKQFIASGGELKLSDSYTYKLSVQAFPQIDVVILAVVSLLILFALICKVYVFLLRPHSRGNAKRLSRSKVFRHANELDDLVANSKELIRHYENESFRLLNSMSARAIDCLGMSRKIVSKLEGVLAELDELLFQGGAVGIMYAGNLLQDKIDLSVSNGIDSLIYQQESVSVPDVSPIECAPVLDRLFEVINEEIRRNEEEYARVENQLASIQKKNSNLVA